MAKVRIEPKIAASSPTVEWWSPTALAFEAKDNELTESQEPPLTLAEDTFYTDVRSAVHRCWNRRAFSGLTGKLNVRARTTFPQEAIPAPALSMVIGALEAGLDDVLAGAPRFVREIATDFGLVEWSLEFTPIQCVESDSASESTVAHRRESRQTASPGNKVADDPGRETVSKDVTEEWQIAPSSIGEAIDRVLTGSPTDPRLRLMAIRSAKHGLMSGLAAAIQEPLQAVVDSMPSESREEKRGICFFVNSTLREIGLAVRCPKTGRPASLIADSRSPDSNLSRFRYAIQDEQGRQIRTVSTAHLLPLEIMEDEPRKEVFSKWAERVRTAKEKERKPLPGD